MQILLVRHGATDWNLQGRCQGVTDLALNEVGVLQAEQMAAVLTKERIHGIYSSHLKRAQQTAHFFSLHHQLPVVIETDVRELDHGELEGLTFAEIKEHYSQFIQKWRTEPAEIQVPGGERLADVARRAWNGLNRIVQRHSPEECVVVVSHNFPILGILCRITGTDLNNYRTFHLDPCSLTRLKHNGGDHWEVTCINNQDHTAETPLAR
ncbi:MAG TPA: histidine phosphatase family protein [Candidatus Binatia bacterium]|nr:histidine phosphatase family protein [Candidatus Binatia bacterium]